MIITLKIKVVKLLPLTNKIFAEINSPAILNYIRCIISVFIRRKSLSKFNTGSLGFKRQQSWRDHKASTLRVEAIYF